MFTTIVIYWRLQWAARIMYELGIQLTLFDHNPRLVAAHFLVVAVVAYSDDAVVARRELALRNIVAQHVVGEFLIAHERRRGRWLRGGSWQEGRGRGGG